MCDKPSGDWHSNETIVGIGFCRNKFRVYGSLNNQGGKLSQSEPVGWVADLRPGDPTWTNGWKERPQNTNVIV